jgi:hypothetical protein
LSGRSLFELSERARAEADNLRGGVKMVTFHDWMSVAIKIRSFYRCPENCCMCCRNGIFRFTGREYNRVLSVLKQEKREAIEAVVVDVSKEQIINEMVGMPK